MITTGRIIGAFSLLLMEPLSLQFFVVYLLCGISDILDGYVARKTDAASKFGEILDSIADLIFIFIMLLIFIPLLTWEQWMLWWVGAIALLRFLSLGIGFAKYRTFSSLHTYANKAAGLVLFCFPLLYSVMNLSASVVIISGLASISALEELIITICSKKLSRNMQSIFSVKFHLKNGGAK